MNRLRPARRSQHGQIQLSVLPRPVVAAVVHGHGLPDEAVHGVGIGVGAQGPADGIGEVRPVHPGEGEAGALAGILIVGLDRIPQPAGLPHDGQGAVGHGDELGDAAGLEPGGHQEEVAPGVDVVAQIVVVADPGAGPAGVALLQAPQPALILAVAVAQQHEGAVVVPQQLIHGGHHQLQALLLGKTGDHADQRPGPGGLSG